MTKKLQSLLEVAIVIGGLAGAPALILTSLGPVVAAAQSVHTVAANDTLPTVSLKF